MELKALLYEKDLVCLRMQAIYTAMSNVYEYMGVDRTTCVPTPTNSAPSASLIANGKRGFHPI
jgi:hypothetical protein